MYLIETSKLCYLAVPRTASNSVSYVLMDRHGAKLAAGRGHHSTVEPIKAQALPIDSDWSIAATVRNHWDCLVSWYFKMTPRVGPFGVTWLEWFISCGVRDALWVQNKRLFGRWTRHADRILRYESLETDLNAWLQDHDLGPVELPMLNVTTDKRRKHYSEVYDEETRAWVAAHFAAEIEQYDYRFEEV